MLHSGLTSAGCQVPTKPLYLSLLSWRGGKNMTKDLWVEIRSGRSFHSYYHTQNRWLGKVYYQPDQSRMMGNKPKFQNHLSPTPPFSHPQLYFLYLHPSSKAGGWRMEVAVSLSHCFSFVLRRKTPHTLPLLQHGVPPMGESFPQTSPTGVLLTGCSSSWTR